MSEHKNPWGNNNQTPPDLDEVIGDLKNKFGNMFGGNGKTNNAKIINNKNFNTSKIKYLVLLAIIIWLFSGIYIIDPAENGIIKRFGKFVEQTTEGPHWHIPYPIENVTIVNVSEIRKIEIGFRKVNSRTRKFVRNIASESLMLTKDSNIVNATFEIQYNISDAKNYLFNVHSPEKTLEQVANSVIREVIGKHNMDYIITEGRADIAQEIKLTAQKLLDYYNIGLHIKTINFNSAQAPDQVQAAYSDVTKAKTDKERYINQAEAYKNDILPKARGASARIIEEANAYKSKVISKSEGEAARFDNILIEYSKAPKVTKERLYRETMEEVFSKTSKIVLDSKNNSLMYLPIDKIIKNNTTKNTANDMANDNQDKTTNVNVRNVFRNRGGQ